MFKPCPPSSCLSLENLAVSPIRDRRSIVSLSDVRPLAAPDATAAELISSLPDFLAARDFRRLIDDIVGARRNGRHVVAAYGGHVLKVGQGPVIVDLLERGVVTAIAMNGAAAIHDYELSLIGETSEDVAAALPDGQFGMARETAEALGRAASAGVRDTKGLGRALGQLILEDSNRHAAASPLAAAARLGVPATIHVAIGTDVVHMHPCVSPAETGAASHADFRILASVVANLQSGVWMNIGSAVIMPEVFLKALSVARNLGHRVDDFSSANLDMFQHYRPRVNVLERPTGRSYAITGHHEIMLPLLRLGILSAMHKGNGAESKQEVASHDQGKAAV